MEEEYIGVDILKNDKTSIRKYSDLGYGQDEVMLERKDIEALEQRKGIRIF